MKPTVFLDFDGVLNSRHTRACDRWDTIDETMVGRVNRICRETGAQVVISSTWRILEKFWDLHRLLRTKGLTAPIRGITPTNLSFCHCAQQHEELRRGCEIDFYLREYPAERPFVILDDDSDMYHLGEFLVQTSDATGITDEDVRRAIDVLNRAVGR